MSEIKNQTTPRKEKPQGIKALLVTLVVSLFFSILIECVGMAFIWPEQGAQHSKNMLNTEFNYLSSDFQDTLIMSDPVRFTENVVTSVHELLMVKTGLSKTLNEPVTDNTSFSVIIVHVISEYLIATINIILVFIIRLVILVLSIPIFLLAAVLGSVDGLVRRDIRRFGAGRESSFIYYHSKRWSGKSLLLSWLIYLSIPISIHPNFILIPMAFLFGLILSITIGSFKKYL
ncbi:putative membrane protein [Gilliamella apicola]|jgi:integrating conjugative element membrane protein, PFL_4697 family|uniref:TIGR03747 family integrating conjugative element membrane protein n=1 Tax=Gilliamella apicola TaxID=1196095 RepID=UPI00042F69D6|nr:TIGR03747 family integrating conjugative element membrane protein [Gilliamella apicola]AHN27258.1 putative membrane protein [Gilliamella apicola]PXV96574.1 integrating conjugative element membrane protein (TIGR03747 family) [Gilliamella apicola]